MNIVTMNLVDLPFNQIKEGSKVIEVRLNDEKRQNIKVGDKIVFTNTKTKEQLEKQVISLTKYDSFKQLFNCYDSILLGARGYNEEEYELCMHKFYSKEQELKYGVLAIELEPIDQDLREVCISREKPYEGRLLKLRKDKVNLANGRTSTREWIEHPGACAIVCVDKDDNILLERQYRYPLGKTIIEIPAGKLDSQLEDRKQCAIRELQEETGLISKDMTYLGQTALAVAYTSEVIYIYYTTDCEQGETNFDDNEILTTFKIPFDKALEMCNNGEIIDSKTIIGINLYNNNIRKNKNKN